MLKERIWKDAREINLRDARDGDVIAEGIYVGIRCDEEEHHVVENEKEVICIPTVVDLKKKLSIHRGNRVKIIYVGKGQAKVSGHHYYRFDVQGMRLGSVWRGAIGKPVGSPGAALEKLMT